ncbi:helix-turn-helix domain-containing protein [Streptococcus anginosus]|uniref:helix-turn-helix domain-containing protein n=1 Tax=Streptococcus anginosus TaxID=1328 RepID=UPI0030815753|nr:helix-turn-helix domain-containing protein [Streptococcus anginosus]
MNQLQELRKKNGDTQKTLAELLGVSEMTISRWEKEKELKIKYEYLQKLTEYFKVSIDHLLGIDIEKINELSSAYKNVEEHINNPVKYNNFGKGLLNHIPSYMFTIEELINADKENNTNFADILINYISLNDYDKKIAFDLVKKLSERDDEKE